MRLFAAVMLMASISAPAFAQASHDTLAEAVDSAIDNNPLLKAEQSSRKGADEVLNQAQAQMGPQVNFQGSVNTLDQQIGRQITTSAGTFPPDGSTQRASVGIEARQSLWSGGSLSAQRDQARFGVDAAQARLLSTQQDLVLAVVTAFVDVRRGEQEVDIRETNVSQLKQQVQAAKDRFQVGEVTRTDVAQAQAREAGAEADLAKAHADLERARATYEQIVGRAPVQLAAPPVAPQLPGSLEAAVAIAQASNLALVSARAQEDAAERGIDVAAGQLSPRVDLVGSAGWVETHLDGTYRDTNVGIGAEVKIPLFNSGLLDSKTRGARIEADRARYQRMAIERDVTAKTTTAWHQVIAAREAITASISRVAAAQVALEGATQELAVGTRITLDVLDQERELLEARLGQVDAERQAYIAVHQLLAAMGRLNADSISK